MDAKEYLRGIRDLDVEIEMKHGEWRRVFELVTGTTAPYDAERVSSSADHQRLAAKSVELAEISREINVLEHRRRAVIAKISRVRDPLMRAVLYDHYVRGKKLTEIALERRYSYAYVAELHANAIKTVQKFLKDPDKS